MADLTMTIGPLVASVNSTNVKATALVSAYADAIGAQGTNQEKADAVLVALIKHMREEGRRHQRNNKVGIAMEQIEQELADLDWTT